MTLYEELYFDITLIGKKSDLSRFISFLKSGELDDFFEFESDYLVYDDDYDTASPDRDDLTVTFTSDDYAIEIDEFDVDEFLDTFCRAAKELDVTGHFYDSDDEYSFVSHKGVSYYENAKKAGGFNEDSYLKEVEKRQLED
jgi:hypothetical protein